MNEAQNDGPQGPDSRPAVGPGPTTPSTTTSHFSVPELGEAEVIRLDGHDNAVVGFGFRFGGVGPVLIYDTAVILKNLMDGGIEDEDDAREFAEFNIYGLWAGEGTPIFLERASYEEIDERLVAAQGEAE